MKMKKIIFTLMLAIFGFSAHAQTEKCATMQILEKRIAKDPSIKLRMEQSEIKTQKWISANSNAKGGIQLVTIPVVVHVLWNDPIENISAAQIQSQIDILNEDFRLLNSDSLPDTHPFWNYTADTEIEFCLASTDPDGFTTTGITRTYTDSIAFIEMDSPKYTVTGGSDSWDPTQYLNLWVCHLNDGLGLLGYAAFPADLATDPDLDGVVISYTAFGYIGTATAPNDLGRTGTHEVGHWLNLRHIWGDDTCGDDFVADTEIAEAANYGCPTFPHNANSTCGSGVDGEMYMNYMDYVDDACMNMFTYDQGIRMQSALNGDRAGLLTSLGCSAPTGLLNEGSLENGFKIYPNPSNGNFTVDTHMLKYDNISISVYDLLGSKIQKFENIKIFPFKMDLNDLSNGIYYFKINCGNKTITQKVIIAK
jgi:hypothetical protein